MPKVFFNLFCFAYKGKTVVVEHFIIHTHVGEKILGGGKKLFHNFVKIFVSKWLVHKCIFLFDDEDLLRVPRNKPTG